MTNQKMSLGEKVGLGITIVSAAGALYFTNSSLDIKPRNYPLLIQEDAIVREQEHFKQHQLKVNDSEALEKYITFTDVYNKSLEIKLEEVKSNPQYIVEQKQSEKDSETRDNYLWKSLFFILLGMGSLFYITKKERQRENTRPSGASQ